MPKKTSRRRRDAFEAEVLPGLEPYAKAELERLGAAVDAVGDGALAFRAADWRALYGLRRVVAVYLRIRFEVPRPKALLGHEHFQRLAAELDRVVRASTEPFAGFRFSAAGSDSPTFQRLGDAIAGATGLAYDDREGELLLRVRPAEGSGAWEVLTRLTPRPLSARTWRTCNMEGGLNATIASAMLDMAAVPDGTAHLNAMCGSGTLLAEWLTGGGGGRSVGCDLSAEALACARDNLAAAGVADVVELLAADAAAMPFDGGSFGLITADVPWGDAVGSHASNARLYPAFLEEAARVARDGAVLVVLTHDVRLFERVLERSGLWVADRVERVFHGGHWPRMYRLVRPGGPSAA